MEKHDIKYRIKESFDERTPDILNSIKNSREFRLPVKTKKSLSDYISFKSFSFSLATVFVLAILVTLVFSSQPATPVVASTITVDINPSIQITLDDEDKVINVTAINIDGEEILSNNIKFRGLSLDETIEILIEAAYNHGFIIETNDENIILISVDSNNEEIRERLESQLERKIANEVNKYASIVRVIKERNPNVTDEQIKTLADTAKENNMTVAKLLLIRTIISLDSTRSLDELKDFSIRELYRIKYKLLNPTEDDTPSNNDDTPGNNDDTPGNNDDTPGNNDDIPGNSSIDTDNNDDLNTTKRVQFIPHLQRSQHS